VSAASKDAGQDADSSDISEFGDKPSLVRSLGSFHTFAARWGLPVNIVAVLGGGFMAINLAWPRNEVYNATEPFHWYLQQGGVLLPGVILGAGFAYYWTVRRHKTGVVAEHARTDVPTDTRTQEA
jgi:hypothetical protein